MAVSARVALQNFVNLNVGAQCNVIVLDPSAQQTAWSLAVQRINTRRCSAHSSSEPGPLARTELTTSPSAARPQSHAGQFISRHCAISGIEEAIKLRRETQAAACRVGTLVKCIGRAIDMWWVRERIWCQCLTWQAPRRRSARPRKCSVVPFADARTMVNDSRTQPIDVTATRCAQSRRRRCRRCRSVRGSLRPLIRDPAFGSASATVRLFSALRSFLALVRVALAPAARAFRPTGHSSRSRRQSARARPPQGRPRFFFIISVCMVFLCLLLCIILVAMCGQWRCAHMVRTKV